MSEEIDPGMFRSTGTTDEGQPVSIFDAPDITPLELMEHNAGIIANALERTGLVTVVETTIESAQSMQLLCRVKTDDVNKLCGVISSIIWKLDGTPFQEHIGTKYIARKAPNGARQTVYGWLFAFMGPDPKKMAHLVCDAIDDVIPREEVLESPLLGAGTGGVNAKGKGASQVRA